MTKAMHRPCFENEDCECQLSRYADGVGNAFIRLKHEAIEVVGHASVDIKREQEDSHE